MAKDTRKPETIIREQKNLTKRARADRDIALRAQAALKQRLAEAEREIEFLRKDNQRLERIAALATELAQERDAT